MLSSGFIMLGWAIFLGSNDRQLDTLELRKLPRLASKGIAARVLQELAGHKHLGTTQRYIDVNDDMLRKAVEVF